MMSVPGIRLKSWVAVAVLALSSFVSGSLWAQTLDHSAGFATHADVASNGNAALAPAAAPTVARLTDGGGSEAGSVFSTATYNIQFFTNTFTFQITPGSNPTADGMAFVIQGNASTSLGAGGGGLGYQGVTKSVCVKFDLYSNNGEGVNSTGLFVNGDMPSSPAGGAPPEETSINLTGSGIDLHSGDVFSVDMGYDGTTLSVTITDQTTNKMATHNYTVDIPTLVGGNTAYIGFTGGTGGLTAIQDVQTWLFNTIFPPAAPTNVQGTALAYPQGLYGNIQVTWSASTGATSYTIYSGPSATGPFNQVGTATTNSFLDTTSVQGQTYYYVVTATNIAGTSPQSAASPAVTALVAPPQTPKRKKTCSCSTILEVEPLLSLLLAGASGLGALVLRRRKARV
jgi:hypothetical protein